MVSGILVGILKEQHADYVVLTDASRILLPDGLVLERLLPGSSITILYRRDNAGEIVVKSITQSATSHLRHLPPSLATDHRRWGYTDEGWR
jgi:hypothetical protein